MPTTAPVPPVPTVTRSKSGAWIDRAIPIAGAWSLLYAALNFFWALGGPGFPFGMAGDEAAELSVLADVDPAGAAPVIAVLGLLGAAVALAMVRPTRPSTVARRSMMAFAVVAAVSLTIVIPDYRVLATVAYLPILLVGAPFGYPEGASLLDLWDWPMINQIICIGGGLAWAGAALAYHRRQRGACVRCGRAMDVAVASWTSPAAAARWGRWAVAVAVVTPLLYAATRWAWALGVPLGITDDFLREMQDNGMTIAGAALASMGALGAVLTLGLVQRWGEVYPRWIPRRGGRRVPPALAIVPASLVSVLITMAGVMFIRLLATDRFGELFAFAEGQWAAIAPELVWPLWGTALAAATLAYHYRRRGPCPRCGRGGDDNGDEAGAEATVAAKVRTATEHAPVPSSPEPVGRT